MARRKEKTGGEERRRRGARIFVEVTALEYTKYTAILSKFYSLLKIELHRHNTEGKREQSRARERESRANRPPPRVRQRGEQTRVFLHY